ncbi:MAG: recombination protein RecT [Conexivisphaerales archaeon]
MEEAKEMLKAKSDYQSLSEQLNQYASEIRKALPNGFDAQRLVRIVLTEIRKNPALIECNRTSLFAAVLTAAQLGLEPGILGQVYFIPYFNKKTQQKEVQFQIGYKGIIDLVRRSGQIASLNARVVYEKDEFEIEFGLNEKLIHKPYLKGDRGNIIGVYAIARYNSTTPMFEYNFMTVDEINKIRDRARSKDELSPWVTDYESMAKKTVLKQLCKYLPLSLEVQRALVNDETTRTVISEDITSEADSTDWDSTNSEAKEDEK